MPALPTIYVSATELRATLDPTGYVEGPIDLDVANVNGVSAPVPFTFTPAAPLGPAPDPSGIPITLDPVTMPSPIANFTFFYINTPPPTPAWWNGPVTVYWIDQYGTNANVTLFATPDTAIGAMFSSTWPNPWGGGSPGIVPGSYPVFVGAAAETAPYSQAATFTVT